jgi:cytosine deaminase
MAQRDKVLSKKAAPEQTAVSPLSFARNMHLMPWYDQEILRYVEEQGGFYNAHAHLCRAYTLQDHFLRHIGTTPIEASNLPLEVKQNLVGDLHRGVAYTEENLRERYRYALRLQIAYGTTRIDTNIDATPDLPEDGLLAIRVLQEVREEAEFKDKILVRIAPTPIFGFKTDRKDRPTRWEVFEAAARISDYLSLLPEKDDFANERDRDGKIGFKQHIRRGVELACDLGKEVQFHLDQMNVPGERGTERMLEMLEGLDQPKLTTSGPSVWIIHMISPSADTEAEFARTIEKLRRLNVGVIVCPTAALSMRQLRSIRAPTHNSIARLAELIKSRVPIRLGTDNIADVFVPQSDGDMLTEIKIGGHAVRMAPPNIWAKLASGQPPNSVDITMVGRMLHEDRKACIAADSTWQPAIE